MHFQDDDRRLKVWFKKLTPAQRLSIAEDIERFRRLARFVED
jgi:hypothetical protein